LSFGSTMAIETSRLRLRMLAAVAMPAADAYRAMRAAQHRARLDEAPTRFDEAELGALDAHRHAVLALWRTVFG